MLVVAVVLEVMGKAVFQAGLEMRCVWHQLARRGARLAFLVWLFSAVAWSPGADKPAAASEYHLKAVFLFNFVKFTEWPAATFMNAASPLVIGVLGDDPFGQTIDDVVKGESVNGRPIRVKRFGNGADVSGCHVLFVSRSEKDGWPALLESLQTKPVLTVSDFDRFCQRGGMINLVLSASGTVKPEINPDAARTAGVQISSKLLNLPMVRLVKTAI